MWTALVKFRDALKLYTQHCRAEKAALARPSHNEFAIAAQSRP